MRQLILALILFCTIQNISAQQDDPAVSELLENFFRSNEGASESDAQLFLERLETLRQSPLDLNTATREDLLSLQLLNELQVEELLNYRRKLGNLLNIYELQAIPTWEAADIRRVQPFVEVGNGSLDQRAAPLYKGLYQGNNEFLMRLGRSVPLRFANGAEGGANAFAIRYRHNFDNRLRFGFTAENDAGEAFFKKSNKKGFDFYSAHLFLNNTAGKFLKSLAIGDYTARMGQGMLLQTGFSPGKSAESVTLLRGAKKLGAYSAFGEAFFLRGVGATFRLSKHFEVNTFASYRRRDANVDTVDAFADEVKFTSFITSGLHRTPSEIENERKIHEILGGATVTYLHKAGQVSINALHLLYDRPFEPIEQPYRLYTFRGKQLTGFSIDHQTRWRNYLIFGENARSDNGGFALLNGLLIGADRRVSLGLVHRYFDPRYQSVYAAPFAEVSSGAANEQGLYTGIEIRPSKPWKINAYADLWRHPWLRFGVDGPSHGQEYLVRVLWQPNKTFQAYMIGQTETKERNAASPENGLVNNKRERIRLHTGYKVGPGLELRSRVEWIFFTEGNNARSAGFLAYQEAVCKPKGFPVSGAVRYAVFDTENFDTRVFSFENDLFSAVSIPGFAGRGSRYYLNLTWRIQKNWRLEGRVETTYLQKAVTSGTVAGRQTVYKVQMRNSF
jgi:hypothetical protein